MTTQFFANVNTVEAIKKLYRNLAFQHHPDLGGDVRTMQEVNRQYEEALRRVDGQTSKGSDGRDHTYTYRQDVEQSIMDKINELIKSGILNDCEIELIGTWVWVTGNTKPHKETLKSLGCRWHSKRQCWYFQNDGYKHRFNKSSSLSGLAAKYGSTKFQDDDSARPMSA